MFKQMKDKITITKVIVAILSLVTLITYTNFDTITYVQARNITIKQRKIKNKHKFIIAKSKKEFKKKYIYHYNRKKQVYYGYLRKHYKKQQYHQPKLEVHSQIADVTTNKYLEYNHPSKFRLIDTFTNDDLAQNYLLGTRWTTKRITFNDDDLSGGERKIAEEAIKQINDLNIVTLIKVSQSADITMQRQPHINNTLLGLTHYYWGVQRYKNLKILQKATIIYYEDNMNKCYPSRILWNYITIHEIGHALGLAHTLPNSDDIMKPAVTADKILTNDGYHAIIDQGYINSLALLYNN